MSGYRRLNMSKLSFKQNVSSYDNAVENVTPFNFSEDVLNGKKKVLITNGEKDYNKKCVKLEISY